jgi:hypothetical protein
VGGLAAEAGPSLTEGAAALARLAEAGAAVAEDLPALTTEAAGTLAALRETAVSVSRAASVAERGLSGISDAALPRLNRASEAVADAAASVSRFAQRLARDPSVLIRGR